jgi:hypothetical protein
MAPRIGLGVGADAVRAIIVRRGAIVWRLSVSIRDAGGVGNAISAILTQTPRSRFRRRAIVVAVGPSAAQVRKLTGLPAVKNSRLLAQAVNANLGRFFLRNGIPLRVSDVRSTPNGTWAGAVELPVLTEIESACRAGRGHLLAVVPSMAVLGHALQPASSSRSLVWVDGDTCAQVDLDKNGLVLSRRVRHPLEAGAARPALATPLQQFGDDGWSFADAYAAAVVQRRGQLAIRPQRDAKARARIARFRRAVCLAAVATAGLAALVAPGLTASRAAASAAAQLDRQRLRQRDVAAANYALVRSTDALTQVADFAAQRRTATTLLGSIAAALPDSTAIVSVRIDSVGGTIVALTPRGAALLPAMRQVAEIDSTQFGSPVSREIVDGRELERVALRFRFPSRKPATRVHRNGRVSP